MTEVRTFRAATMQVALEIVRRERGGDAVILNTRQVALRRLLPWGKGRQEVEITAGLGVQVRPLTARGRASTESANVAEPAAPRRPQRPTTPAVEPRRRFPIDAVVETEDEVEGVEIAFSTPVAPKPHRPVPAPLAPSRSRTSPRTEPVQRREAHVREKPSENAPPRVTPPARRKIAGDSSSAFAERLDSIERMLEQLGQNLRTDGRNEIPAELFQLYTRLVDQDVDDALARDLVLRLKRDCTPSQLADPTAADALLTALIESELRCGQTIAPVRGRRTVVALVGATGVGKTTTIAKLAANFRLRDGLKTGLITVDTYRVAAVEQLRTYAEIIDLPMKVVTEPREMRRALDELAGLDLVLIDTAGRSPRDDLQIQELKRLLSEADVDQTQLVLSVTTSRRNLESAAEKFAAVDATGVILTKLDEAENLGGLLSFARTLKLPISYVTTGQAVPDDSEPARPARLARLILGNSELDGG